MSGVSRQGAGAWAGVHLLLVVLASAGCAAGEGGAADPAETVTRYVAALGRDPLRTLALVTDGFQRAHGLRWENAGDQPLHESAGADAARRPVYSVAEERADPALELERARLGWLTVLSRHVFQNRVPQLTLEIRAVRMDDSGDAAAVEVEVRGPQARPLPATFSVMRSDASRGWRIDAIAIDLAAERRSPASAFLIAPTRDRLQRVGALDRARRGR